MQMYSSVCAVIGLYYTVLNNWSTTGLGSLGARKISAKRYTQAEISDAVDEAVELIEHYDASNGVIRSKVFSAAFPAVSLANAVKQRMKLIRCDVGGGDQGYPVQLRYGVWRGL